MKKVSLWIFAVVLSYLLILPVTAVADKDHEIGTPRWTIDEIFGGDAVPFAIGHRGYGVNLGEDPDRPIENTTKAVRRAFREGIMIVEVDAVLTADNIPVALHDDYLPDLTCINTLTFEQLKETLGEVSSLRQILKVSRTYSVMKKSDRPSGQVVVEIKTPSAFCVPLEQEFVTLQALVDAVLDDIRFTRMTDQVTIESFSPEILALAGAEEGEPTIPRMLALDALQLLPPEWIEANTAYKVRPIDKDSFGLPWGEIGLVIDEYGTVLWLYRLPGYYPQAAGEDPFENYIWTLAATGSATASLDKNVLFMADSQGVPPSSIVDAMHFFGFYVLVYTADDQFEWMYISSAGADGIFVDNIPMGLMMEGQ